MKCANPYMYKQVIPFGCGQCMHCRINKRRLWQHRLMLESLKHRDSCMLTLTYATEHLPPNGSLSPDDLKNFMKRLRRKVEPFKLRFFAVGEYGEENFRPHYHIALFGLSNAIPNRDLINSAWGLGLIDFGYDGELGRINKDSAQYIAGYVTKKLTKKDDPRLQGRHPEFTRQSNRPGIGATAMDDLVHALTTDSGCESILRSGDVPMSLTHNNKQWPLGRYLRRILREKLGFPNTGAQEGWEDQLKIRAEEEMLELCISQGILGLIKAEEDATPAEKLMIRNNIKSGIKRQILIESNEGYNKQLEFVENSHKRKGRRL